MKRMNDDDVMNYVYTKLFGDIDGIRAKSMYADEDGTEEAGGGVVTATNDQDRNPDALRDNSLDDGGLDLDKDPVMENAREGGRDPQHGDMDRGATVDEVMNDTDDSDEEGGGKKKRLKGIGRLSPLMAQLHGED